MRVRPCVLPEAAAGPGQAIGVDGLEMGRGVVCVRALRRNRVKVRGAVSALGLPLLPPHLSSRPPQVALATFEPSLFVKVILFGLSRLGRFPGTAKPKAKSEQGTGSRYGRGSSAVWFFYRWDSSSPPLFQVFLDFSALSTVAFPGFGLSRRGAWSRALLVSLARLESRLERHQGHFWPRQFALLVQILRSPPRPAFRFREAVSAESVCRRTFRLLLSRHGVRFCSESEL